MTIVFASQNTNKFKELKALIAPKHKILLLKDLGWEEDIEESGNTLEENSLIKARFAFEKFGRPSLADDSGLEVDFLHGEPGVFSARYAGEEKNDEANIEKLLSTMGNCKNRQACFKTVFTYIDITGPKQFVGTVAGSITHEKRGTGGFGYDPVFIPESYEDTFAELPLSTKNKISHRAMATKKFIDYLNRNF